MNVPHCFVFRHSSSRHRLQGSQRLGALTPAVIRDLHAKKTPTLLALPVIDFHQRLRLARSSFKGLGELRVSSTHGLQVHERAMQLGVASVLGLTESLCNVTVVQTLLPLRQIVSYAASCQSIETSNFQKLFVRHPSSNFGSTQCRWICLQLVPAQFAPANHSTGMSSLDRFTSELISPRHGKKPDSDNFSFFEPVCSSLSSSRTCSTMGTACGGADDDDDPQCATDVGNLFDVETAGESGSVVCSANLTFFMFGSASVTERDIVLCASLTPYTEVNI